MDVRLVPDLNIGGMGMKKGIFREAIADLTFMMIALAPSMAPAVNSYTVNYFIVTYNANAPGSQSPMIDTAMIGYLYGVKFNLYSNPGYTFYGWNSLPDGTGVHYSPGMSIAVSADMTLYAQWKPISPERVSITCKANAGDSQADVTDLVNKGSAYALRANPFARSGYTFVCWNTQANGAGNDYNPGRVITANGGLTLYARWKVTEADSVTITYRANASDSRADVTDIACQGSSYTLRASPFTRSGYVFTGWNTQANGSGNVYNPGKVITANGGLTLYAQWKVAVVETVIITYKANANDSQADMKDTAIKGSSYTLRANPFARSGCTFTGWSTQPSGSGNAYKPGQTFIPSANRILYAQWKAVNSTVKKKPK